MKKEITLQEVAIRFLKITIPIILEVEEFPKFHIIFPKEAFSFFEELRQQHKINQNEIENLKKISQLDNIHPTIYVRDYQDFFQYLASITNQYTNLNNFYFDQDLDPFTFVDYVITRVWLRMGPTDISQIEKFLETESQFLSMNELDDYCIRSNFMSYYNHDILIETNLNSTLYETTRCMTIQIYEKNQQKHILSNIHYDIVTEKSQSICYIYAIQKGNTDIRNSKLERLVYKINEGILETESKEYLDYYHQTSDYYPENIVNVHPNQVLALLTFIGVLRKHHITQIRVPILQVLSYDFHILLSKKVKKEFVRKWDQEALERIDYLPPTLKKRKEKEYEQDKRWYDHIVDKEDNISENKIEKFIRLFNRVQYHYPDMEIRNEPLLEGDYLDIRIPILKKRKKERPFINDSISI